MSSNYCDTCWCPYVFHTIGDNDGCANGDCNMITYGFGICSGFVETIDLHADNNKQISTK